MALQWSKAMEDLYYYEVVRPVQYDRRTDWDDEQSISLGYPFQVIRRDVIKSGLADFSDGHHHPKYGDLSADDKVLLYCFANMKLHFFESLATLRRYNGAVKAIFDSNRTKLMIDLGCGPGTAGLALAEFLNRPNAIYIGLDRAQPMLRKAKSLLGAAIERSMLAPTSRVVTTSSWATLRQTIGKFTRPANVLINATYLFASDSLDVDEVCDLVTGIGNQEKVRRLLFMYSNSNDSRAGVKFTDFKKRLKDSFETNGLKRATIEFHKKRASNATVETTYVRELLVFKED